MNGSAGFLAIRKSVLIVNHVSGTKPKTGRKKMRLSTAIRLGSMLGRQIYGALVTSDGGSCAVGAACMAVGIIPAKYIMSLDQHTKMKNMFPTLYLRGEINSPCDCVFPFEGFGISIYGIITHLNDAHKWTRERIADWVAGIENEMWGPELDIEVECVVTSEYAATTTR
jgi:hypothetical protein